MVSIMSISRSDCCAKGDGWQDMVAGDEDQGEKCDLGCSSESESPGGECVGRGIERYDGRRPALRVWRGSEGQALQAFLGR